MWVLAVKTMIMRYNLRNHRGYIQNKVLGGQVELPRK